MNALISSILLWHVVVVLSKSVNITTTNNTTTNTTETKDLELQIDALEKEKDELLNKINQAIDESVKALERVNDSDSNDGRQYLMELRQQIKELDEADSDESDEKNATSSENHINEVNATDEFRRFGKIKRNDPKSFLAERVRLKKRYKKGSAFMQTAQHLKVEKDIRDWIAMKNEEKRKIREYRLKRKLEESHYEICPRFGERRKKKKRRKKRKKAKEGDLNVQNRYMPCCRKCCKKSYLGCL
ncbi:uncharacterized protein [Choristoneura fumiferana]|uniref:uncharacterized protein n=1 Tax=Choristoneura fumiferana TaxID=7141 RepID=UPI003D158A02